MRHAYLIIAHGNWNQLKFLLSKLDHVNKSPLTEAKEYVCYGFKKMVVK